MTQHFEITTKNSAEQLLLYGDLSRKGKEEQIKALWETEPKNPIFYAEYALEYLKEKKTLPADFLKVANENDPDNAWFPCFAAALVAKDLCKKGAVHPSSPVSLEDIQNAHPSECDALRRRMIYQYKIVDKTKADEALELWRKSLAQSKYANYQLDLYRLRYPIIARQETYQDHIRAMAYLASATFHLAERNLIKLLITSLYQADMKSREGKLLLHDVEMYFERYLKTEPACLIDVLVMNAFAHQFTTFAQVMDTSEMDAATVERWHKRIEQFDAHSQALQAMKYDASIEEALQKHSSSLSALTVPAYSKKTLHHPPLQPNDFTPLRLAEQAIFLRLMITPVLQVLIFLLPIHLLIKRKNLQIRLSEHAWLALPQRAQMMTALFAILPLLYYAFLYVFTPLALSEYSLVFTKGLLYIPFLGTVMLTVALPRLMVHHFTAHFENLVKTTTSWHSRFGWLFAVLLLLPMHLMPWLLENSTSFPTINIFIILCYGPMTLWLTWNWIRGLFMRDIYQRIMHGMQRKVLMTSTVASIVALSLIWYGSYPWEKYWSQRDSLMNAVPDNVSTGAYEAAIIKTMHKELLENMGLNQH